MHRTLTGSFFAVAVLALLSPPLLRSAERANSQPAYLRVFVPVGAQLSVDGTKTQQSGETRRFESPPLPSGQRFVYTLKATWKQGGKDTSREEIARVRAGEETTVDFRPAELREANKDDTKKTQDKEPDVIYVPTPQDVVDKMLELAEVKKDDVVYDLGCGDGRIVVTAAKKYGVKATGFDIDPQRIKESNENVKKNNVEELVTIKKEDIFTLDLSKANVITLYLLPQLNVKLMPQLEKLKPGSRIVSHDFDMRGAKPKKVIHITAKDDHGFEKEHTIYLWVVPWERE